MKPNSLKLLATVSLVVTLLWGLGGCVATKYQLASRGAPPAQVLDRTFPPAGALHADLVTVITYGGPGSWKREALWDEYIVVLHNDSEQPITVEGLTLTDAEGSVITAGTEPWALEKHSKRLETQYRANGKAFVRAAGPGVAIVGAGAAAAAATMGGEFLSVGVGTAGAALTAITVLPIYYTTVVTVNQYHKHRVMQEFSRRRLPLPVTLAPGETRTGSLFYPTIRSPIALELRCASDSGGGAQAALPLDFLSALHVPATAVSTSRGTDYEPR